MSDNDLIRRGDALAAVDAEMRRYGFGLPGGRVDQMRAAINAIPAVQPTVKPLVWHNFDAWTYWAKTQLGTYHVKERNGIWRTTLAQKNGEGEIIYEYTTDGSPDDYQAAKAAAQADYEARILPALDMQPTVSSLLLSVQQDCIKERQRAERLEEALLWCGGSADFNEGGVAREGWLKVCAPLLKGESHD